MVNPEVPLGEAALGLIVEEVRVWRCHARLVKAKTTCNMRSPV